MKLENLRQLAHLLNIPFSVSLTIHKIAVDTRLLTPGDLYFALKGLRVDGHHFLAEAKNKGAIAAVVSLDYTGSVSDFPLIRVKDPLETLQELAKKCLEARKTKIVAITGSVGKTTTKDFVTTLLGQRYTVGSTPGNSNSQIGVPLSILNHTEGTEDILVIEMGMTHPGQIQKLVEIAPPHLAIISTVDLVHAGNFENLSGIAQAKAEIFSHPKTECGIFDFEIQKILDVKSLRIGDKISCSTVYKQADYFLENHDAHLSLTTFRGESIPLKKWKVPGLHNLHNVNLSIACARYLGVEWEEIIHAIAALKLPEKRLERVLKKGVVFINDSYNASAVSVKAALSALPSPAPGQKKVAVIGEMLELGKYSYACHHEVAEEALDRVDQLFCLGKECAPIQECWEKAGRPVELFLNREELVKSLKTHVQEGDVVLLKGSRANCLWKVIEEF